MSDNEADTIPLLTHGQTAVTKSDLRLRWNWLKMRARLLQKWWLRPHRAYQPLFVIATWRSGSNLLLSYLKQQPHVAMLSEVLCSRLPIGPIRDCLPTSQALQHIRFCLQGERAPVRGCKLMLHHLSNCNLSIDDLQAAFPEARYIILYRESLAEQFVSFQTARATRQFRLHEGEQQRQIQITVDPPELRNYCDDLRRRYHTVIHSSAIRERAVLLSYESLTGDPNYWLRDQICPLLNIPFSAPETRIRKQSTRPLAQQIANYSQVSALLNSPLCRQQYHLPTQQPHNLRRAA